jgi:hypothetical protein
VALPACVLLSGFCVFGLHQLEVKYAKGGSNLGRLAVFCRELPTWQTRASVLPPRAVQGWAAVQAALDALRTN